MDWNEFIFGFTNSRKITVFDRARWFFEDLLYSWCNKVYDNSNEQLYDALTLGFGETLSHYDEKQQAIIRTICCVMQSGWDSIAYQLAFEKFENNMQEPAPTDSCNNNKELIQ